ncbi:nucleoporin [Panus rudis PR-1116 ss-1]|nr:nucleoporin [Panus rudis PR-1116 ss-1]
MFQSTAPSSSFPKSINGKGTQHTPSPTPLLDLPALQSASRVLHDQFVKDAQAVPELGEMLTTSGLQSSAAYSVFPDDYRVPFQKRRLVRIPESLFQYYNTTNVTTHMGLLPELDRVWITIDQNLFLWDYIEGQELSSFSDQPDVITHVALVKPKPGVFIDEITSLLVLCTPVSILLIGISVADVPGPSNRTRKEIKMYATDMSVPCEVEMSSVAGTSDGRIFMTGVQDGHLYELHYQEKEGWFGKRVQLINHSVGGVQSLLPRLGSAKAEDRMTTVVSDSYRNLFYTLTVNNTISVYRTNGDKAVQHLQTISNLYKLAQDKAPGSPALTPKSFSIISLHVLEPGHSQYSAQLMAITTNGVRLFFGTSSSLSRQLQLLHVRLPPSNLIHPDEALNPMRPPSAPSYGLGQQGQQITNRPYLVSTLDIAAYEAGLTIAAQPGDTEDTDFLLCMSPDLTRIGNLGQLHAPAPQMQPPQPQYNTYGAVQGPTRPVLTEYATLLTIPGRTWAMAPVPRPPLAAAAITPSDCPAPTLTNELSTQFSEPSRQFMILTNVGLTFLAKRRALDYLQAVIEEYQVEGNAQPLIEFRDSFGRDQTCAMLLAIAAGNTFLDIGEQSYIGTISIVNPDLAAVARQAFYDFGERPIWTERTTYGTSEGSGTATFSGRREGLALYFARLVRPIWKAKVVKPGPFGLQEPNISDDVLVVIQKNLFALKEMLDRNPHLFHSAPGDHAGVRSAAATEQEAWKVEQASVFQLLSLLSRTIEAISFILLLTDHRIGELIAQCDVEVQKTFQTLTFEQLVTDQSGVNVSRALVNVVINQQIGQQISVDTISEVLQQRCGSFCSTDDVMLYKARENVRKAAETKNPAERQNWLAESLRLFTKGARIMEFEKLREIVGDYQQLNYAKGAIELPLYCAQVFDIDHQGQDYWYSGCPANDPRAEFWQRRLNCYDLVLDSLQVFEDRSDSAAAQTGSLEDPQTVKRHAYELALASEDEMFHSTLYDWLIQRGFSDELLEMRPVYLEAHLRREPATVEKYQLLWQFYVKDGQPLRAAEVLGALADSTEFDLPLEARLEYLTLAVGNAKSHPVSVGGKHETAVAFLTELEEKLEVAQVQLETYHALLPQASQPGEVGAKIKLLSKALFNITELYQGYAVPFDLPTIKLLILHVSEHRDDNIVRPIWNKLFEQGEKHKLMYFAAMEGLEPAAAADRIASKVIPLGSRFYPSESAFPLRHVASLLVRFALANKAVVPFGWAPRILVQCGVPHAEVWDILHEMYESQIPPFNEQANVQHLSSDIAILLTDWLEEAKRPQAGGARTVRGEFPVYRIDQAVDQYLSELAPDRTETKVAYENIKRQLRRNW